MEFLFIPSGTFVMGRDKPFKDGAENEFPAHEVSVPFAFKIAATPVTQKEYLEVTGTNPSYFCGENRPVDSVTFEEAATFCKTLTSLMHENNSLPEDQIVSLPGEALWEYVASLSDNFPKKRRALKNIAWYEDNSEDETKDVAGLQSFPDGVYDLVGNVLEWCIDSEAPHYKNSPVDATPCIFETYESKRALRGGSWADPLPLCHKTIRQSAHVSLRSNEIGFRCYIVPSWYEAKTLPKPPVDIRSFPEDELTC